MPLFKKIKSKEENNSNTQSITMARKVLRGKRGILQNLPDMPVDILLEVVHI